MAPSQHFVNSLLSITRSPTWHWVISSTISFSGNLKAHVDGNSQNWLNHMHGVNLIHLILRIMTYLYTGKLLYKRLIKTKKTNKFKKSRTIRFRGPRNLQYWWLGWLAGWLLMLAFPMVTL